MGRRRESADTGEQSISGQMEDKQSRIPAWDHGCFLRPQDSASCPDDGFSAWENRDSEQHLRLLHRSRSIPHACASADSGDGENMEPRQASTTDCVHTGYSGSDRRPKSEKRRQHDHTEGFQQRCEVEHCGEQLPSRVSLQTHPHSFDGRGGSLRDKRRRMPSSVSYTPDKQLLQSQNLSVFDSYGTGRISYRSCLPRVRSASFLSGVPTLQGVADA